MELEFTIRAAALYPGAGSPSSGRPPRGLEAGRRHRQEGVPQAARDLVGGGADRSDETAELLAAELAGRPGDADRPDRLPGLVPDRRPDAAHPRRGLLVVEGVAPLA